MKLLTMRADRNKQTNVKRKWKAKFIALYGKPPPNQLTSPSRR